MKIQNILLVCATAMLIAKTLSAPLPHIVALLVDDWGHADVGFHRPGFNETITPNIDDLATSGVILDQFYAHKYCSPTRSSLQSGRLPYHVNVLNDDMAIWNRNDPVSGFAGIPRNMTTIGMKMKLAGYQTAMAGKWDAGMATFDHTPLGRGYDSSLHYFHHANDYWTSIDGALCNKTDIVDLFDTDHGASTLNNSWLCSQSNQAPGCRYEDELFLERVLATIEAHDPSQPFFLFWAPHIVHAPLQVPQFYLDKFAWIGNDNKARQSYMAMVNYLDDMVGQVVAALKKKGMWDNLLWTTNSDNGGPIYQSGAAGANNWPMRGGKMSNWQGGIRVNAFASGGLIPQSQRGTVNSGLMVAADWYSTFCALAGVDPTDERAAVAGLPPIDSLNMWPLLSGATTVSPRAEIVVGSDSSECGFGNGTMVQALIRADGYKLIIGSLGQNIWTGPYYPNATTKWNDTAYNCGIPPNNGTGCLFNILSDPTEHVDLASTSPDIVAAMLARINEYQATAFSPNRGTDDGSACRASRETWGGFWGPFTV